LDRSLVLLKPDFYKREVTPAEFKPRARAPQARMSVVSVSCPWLYLSQAFEPSKNPAWFTFEHVGCLRKAEVCQLAGCSPTGLHRLGRCSLGLFVPTDSLCRRLCLPKGRTCAVPLVWRLQGKQCDAVSIRYPQPSFSAQTLPFAKSSFSNALRSVQ